MSLKVIPDSEIPAIVGGVPIRTPDRRILLGVPDITESDVAAVSDCLRSQWVGTGPLVSRFEEEFARYRGASHAAATSSATAAIHLVLVALGIGTGDEVLAPSMTFFSSVHSIVHTGATPVLYDCDRLTANADTADIERRITARTRAILVVHMAGRCANMDEILEIARRHSLRVVEDCAHAIESTWRGTSAGLVGDAGTFSFGAQKSITTGEGGMVISNDAALVRTVKHLSLHGITADAWTRLNAGGSYEATAAGFKYNMTDISAAMGLSQLREVDRRWQRREVIWREYKLQLQGLPIILPPDPEPHGRHGLHLFAPMLDLDRLSVDRETVRAALRRENIGSGVHYEPVHAHAFYRDRFGYERDSLPGAAWVGSRTFSLPFSASLSDADVADVCTGVRRVLLHYQKNDA